MQILVSAIYKIIDGSCFMCTSSSVDSSLIDMKRIWNFREGLTLTYKIGIGICKIYLSKQCDILEFWNSDAGTYLQKHDSIWYINEWMNLWILITINNYY